MSTKQRKYNAKYWKRCVTSVYGRILLPVGIFIVGSHTDKFMELSEVWLLTK